MIHAALPRCGSAMLAAALLGCSGQGSRSFDSQSLDATATDRAVEDAAVEDAESASESEAATEGGAADDGGESDADADAPAAEALSVVGTPLMVTTFGRLCGLAFDATRASLWVLPCLGSTIHELDTAGAERSSLARPGEPADDGDLEVAGEQLSLGDRALAAGTPVFINGETELAELYPLDTAAGAPFATAFGNSHVVGGAHHPGRGSFFAVQDRVPGGALGNLVAELDLATGAVQNSFSTLPNFQVNYGDLDVCASSGHLFLVSSVEPAIAELTPEGDFVAAHGLPEGITELSGLAIDDTSGRAWVASTGGRVAELAGFPCAARP
jgi:hypothetical protein